MKSWPHNLSWLRVDRRDWRALLGFGVAIVLFAGLTLFGVQRLWSEREQIRVAHETGSWAIVQAEFELVRFVGALDRFALGSQDISHDELVERYDILFSRLPILIEGPNADLVRPVEGLAATAQLLLDTLKSLESSVLNLRQGDDATYHAIRSRVASFEEPWHHFTLSAMVNGAVFYDGKHSDNTLTVTLMAYFGLLLSGGLFVALLWRRASEVRHLAQDLRKERDTWQRTGHRLGDAIEALPQAFALFDGDDRLVLCNHQFRTFMASGGNADPVGQTLEQLLRRGAEAGLYAAVREEKVEAIVARHLVYHSAYGHYEFSKADGRRMRSEERQTADGGRLVVLTDITAPETGSIGRRFAGTESHAPIYRDVRDYEPDQAYAAGGSAGYWR